MKFGAKSGAMMNANSALPEATWVFPNPASLGYLQAGQLTLHTSRAYDISSILSNSIQLTLPVRQGSMMLAASRLGFEAYSDTRIHTGIAYPLHFGSQRQFMLAALGSVRHVTITNFNNASTWSLSPGAVAKLSHHLFVGISAPHYFQPRSMISFPKRLVFGLTYYQPASVSISLALKHENTHKPSINAGIQLWPVKQFAIRGGISSRPLRYGLGAGIHFSPLFIDLAGVHHYALGWTPGISIGLTLIRRKDSSESVN